jgi:hypothetical protein
VLPDWSDPAHVDHVRMVRKASIYAQYKLSKGKGIRAPNFLPYRAIAYTCTRCGELLTRSSIRRDQPGKNVRHDCDNAVRRRVWADKTPEQKRDFLSHRAAVNSSRIEALRKQAKNFGKEWTGPELEIALRDDLTAAEVAEMLGRSLQAVHTVRWRATTEPRVRDLLGQPRSTDDRTPPP